MAFPNHKITVIILSCLFILALSLGFSSMHGIDVWATEAKGLTESAQSGQNIFEEVNCLMCHLLNGEGGGLDDAPDLAGVSTRLKPEEMKKWLKDHLYEEPRLSMFEEDPTDDDIGKLTDYLQTL
ncbi:cytochrome c [bacterium]|nr:cytochrome c [bacterium]